MAIASPTINHASPAQELYTQVVAVFDAHSNWTFIETFTITTNTYYVWKNHGTGVADNNSLGSDFYVVFSHATAAGSTILGIRAFENWSGSGASGLMQRPVMEDASNAVNADASGMATAGVVASTATGPMVLSLLLQAAPNNNECFILVTKNFFAIAYRRQDNTQQSCYVGLYETRVTIANEFPLCMMTNNTGISNMNAVCGTSRHPFREGQAANTGNFQWTAVAFTTTRGDTANVDPLRGKAMGSRVALSHNGGTSIANLIAFGGIKGLLYDAVILPAASGVTLTMGDTLDDFATEDYWYFALGGLVAWVNKAAV